MVKVDFDSRMLYFKLSIDDVSIISIALGMMIMTIMMTTMTDDHDHGDEEHCEDFLTVVAVCIQNVRAFR